MPSVINERVLFNSVPEGLIELGKTLRHDVTESIDLDNVPLYGGFLLKTLVASPDPFLREMMLAPGASTNLPTVYKLGETMTGFVVVEVIRTESEDVKIGEHYTGFLPFQSYTVLSAVDGTMVRIKNEHNLPWSSFVGVCGMPGQTAYMAWKEYSRAKKGETAYVTAGAGSVGSLVIQLARRDGLKVIASAGSDEKVEALKEIYGADVAFNYKTTDSRELLQKEGGFDVFWDNVGGRTLEDALATANRFARFIECGMIVGYNSVDNAGTEIKGIYNVVMKSLTMSGFLVFDLFPKYMEEFMTIVPKMVADGELKYQEHAYNGLGKVEEAMSDIFLGKNVGKPVVIIP